MLLSVDSSMDLVNQEFIKLSWAILESKYIYYILDGKHQKSIPDHEYDVLERRYKELGKILNKECSATNMVGFDLTRPSCKLVVEKLKV